MKPIHLLLPMSGQGTRYAKAGYTGPKPLIPVSGKPMIERLLSVFPERWPTHFVMAENHRETALPELLRKLRSGATQDFVQPHSLGPGHAVEAALSRTDSDSPILVSYCDYGMIWDPAHFERFVEESACDACVISYRGFHAHYLSRTMYAYSRLEGERVKEIREKASFTADREAEFASAGAYYFKNRKVLERALAAQKRLGLQLSGEFYISLTVEALLRDDPNAHVRVFEIPGFFQWGTPEDLKTFEYWERSFRAWSASQAKRLDVAQLLMPMAGAGSRFREFSQKPKPLIPLSGQPLFIAALETLPKAERNVLVALETFSTEVSKAAESARIAATLVRLKETPSGQALSTEAGVAALAPNQEVVVSACDHGIVLSESHWKALRASGADAAIFTVRGFPGAARRPEAYAYVVPREQDQVSEVVRVSVKKPVSARPSDDAVLVGTFWFRDPEVLQTGIRLLKERDVRVNGELYLDSVFELLLAEKRKVVAVPLDGYLCWGDPDSLAETLYWHEVFSGHRLDRRSRFPGGLGGP